MLVLGILLLASATNFRGQLAHDYSTYASAIREHIFKRNANYESLQVVPPISNRTDVYSIDGSQTQRLYSRAGTVVSVGLRVFKIVDVNPSNGELSLKVWYRLQWRDERLSWNPKAFGDVTQVYMRAADSGPGAATEIWVPDVIVYNSGTGTGASLEPAVATVDFDGTVFWSRPGVLHLLCAFTGLNNFPYDTLVCPVDLGGWLISPAQQGLALLDEGIALPEGDPTERSARSTYSQWSLLNATAAIEYFEYPAFPGVPWPIVSAVVTLQRDAGLFYLSVLLALRTCPSCNDEFPIGP